MPWHPALVHFPIACWVLATLVDVVGQFHAIPEIDGLAWSGVSHLLLWCGVLLALPAMAAGLRDFLRLPDEIRSGDALSRHVVLMGTAWLLFLAAAVWRTRSGAYAAEPSLAMTLLEFAGSACLIVGGHFAGVVVFGHMSDISRRAP
jgi:uncharacterized membrane protein